MSEESRTQRMLRNPVRLALCVLVFIGSVPYAYLLSSSLHIPAGVRPFVAWPLSVVMTLFVNWCTPILWKWIGSSIDGRWFFSHYAADRQVGVSHVEAMISKGEYENATAEIDALLAKYGLEPAVCRVAIDFHLGRFGSREHGERLLLRMRQENSTQYERMATQRLIDIYIEKPETRGKALTELRRLATKFPGTPDAAGALRAIEQLKANPPAQSFRG